MTVLRRVYEAMLQRGKETEYNWKVKDISRGSRISIWNQCHRIQCHSQLKTRGHNRLGSQHTELDSCTQNNHWDAGKLNSNVNTRKKQERVWQRIVNKPNEW